MLKKVIKNEKGFTLVELLAVIVILGIISAIAVPSIGNIIDKAERDATIADAIQVINAAKLAHASNPNDVEWDQEALAEFLDKSNDEDGNYTVSLSDGVYSITGHDAVSLVVVAEEGTATEAELISAEDPNE